MSKPIEKCTVCGGKGEYEIAAHQEGGNVVDGQWIECECQKVADEEQAEQDEE